MRYERLCPEVRAILERAQSLACGEVHVEHLRVALALAGSEVEAADLSSAA